MEFSQREWSVTASKIRGLYSPVCDQCQNAVSSRLWAAIIGQTFIPIRQQVVDTVAEPVYEQLKLERFRTYREVL